MKEKKLIDKRSFWLRGNLWISMGRQGEDSQLDLQQCLWYILFLTQNYFCKNGENVDSPNVDSPNIGSPTMSVCLIFVRLTDGSPTMFNLILLKFQPNPTATVGDTGFDGTSNTTGCSSGNGLSSIINLDCQSNGVGIISITSNLHNGCHDETLFTKPPARDGMTIQVINL